MRFDVPEGATPIEDTDGLIPEIVTYQDLCAVEAENILLAMRRHLGRRRSVEAHWFDEAFVRKVHADMFGAVWRWAGTYRQAELTVGVPSHKVIEEIGRMVGDFRYWNTLKPEDMSVLERAVRLHHRLVWIHPFRNGNGRHARIVADIYLHSRGHVYPTWPSTDLQVAGETRERYLEALRAADREDFSALLSLTESLL
ncbi:MAG: mobile mystery protein B [Elusimicrobiota bacterium]